MEDCGYYSSSNYLGVDRIWCNCMFWNQFPFGDNQWYSMFHLLQYGCTCWNLKSQVTYGGLFKKYTPRIEDTVHPHHHVLGVTTVTSPSLVCCPTSFHEFTLYVSKQHFRVIHKNQHLPSPIPLYGRLYGPSILQLSPNLPVNPNSWQERCLGKMVSPPSWAAKKKLWRVSPEGWKLLNSAAPKLVMKLKQKWWKKHVYRWSIWPNHPKSWFKMKDLFHSNTFVVQNISMCFFCLSSPHLKILAEDVHLPLKILMNKSGW